VLVSDAGSRRLGDDQRLAKTGSFVYARRRIAYERMSSENGGNIMQAYGRVAGDNLTLRPLSTLSNRLRLAPRGCDTARTIDEEVTFALGHSTVDTVSDDLRNIYNRVQPSD
jgi:hypothetical protein